MNLSKLRAEIRDGKKFEYELFWKGPFSQWARQGFTFPGTEQNPEPVYYKTAEHWMMAEKARLFEDEETRRSIIQADHPREAKDLGRKVKNFNEETWTIYRYVIVLSGNMLKFAHSEEYQKILLGTGDRILVEASPEDRIWGIGLAENHPDATNPMKWRGLNLLGFALTEVRDLLKKQ